jgi:2-polyprenyl-3-methyl-5-hydroxy-6-metoxy-1,4-benzoquinol methylase
MTAKLRRDYYESVWEAVPRDAQPTDLGLRRAFLLEHLRALATAAAPSVAKQDTEPLRVLDVGCGEAQLTAAVAAAGFQVLGLDVAEEPLRRAREHHPELDLRLVEPEGEWPLPDASFDAVWAGETIEHVLDTGGWLSQVRRLLRPGGSLLLSTPAHGPLVRLGLGLSARRFERRFDPRADHLRFYTRRSLARLLEDFRFEALQLSEAAGLPGARRVLFAAAVRSRF